MKNKKKIHDAEQCKLREEQELKKVKEYLYKMDLGKLLLVGASKQEKKIIFCQLGNAYYDRETYTYSDGRPTYRRKYDIILVTESRVDSVLDDYKIFVRDVLKIDVEIKKIKNVTTGNVWYEASWN